VSAQREGFPRERERERCEGSVETRQCLEREREPRESGRRGAEGGERGQTPNTRAAWQPERYGGREGGRAKAIWALRRGGGRAEAVDARRRTQKAAAPRPHPCLSAPPHTRPPPSPPPSGSKIEKGRVSLRTFGVRTPGGVGPFVGTPAQAVGSYMSMAAIRDVVKMCDMPEEMEQGAALPTSLSSLQQAQSLAFGTSAAHALPCCRPTRARDYTRRRDRGGRTRARRAQLREGGVAVPALLLRQQGIRASICRGCRHAASARLSPRIARARSRAPCPRPCLSARASPPSARSMEAFGSAWSGGTSARS
jgi:hypothetical protein